MTRSDRACIDFVVDLLDEYAQHVGQHGDPHPVPFPSGQRAERLRKSIEKALGIGHHSFSLGGAFHGAHDWWQKNVPANASADDCFLSMKILLSTLDRSCSDKPMSRWKGSRKALIIGRRFWNVFGRCGTGQGPLDGQHQTTSHLYHHLHAGPLKEDEWHAGDLVSRAFGSFVRQSRSSSAKTIPLRVGLFAFSKSVKTFFAGTDIIDPQYRIHGFLSDRVEHESAAEEGYLQELRECIEWAGREHLHVLIMPELAVCPKGYEVLRQEIIRTPHDLCIVIPGSYHVASRQHENRHANAAPIWLIERTPSGQVHMLPHYEKHDPFRFEVEGAKNDERVRDVFVKAEGVGCQHCQEDVGRGSEVRLISTPVGVISVAICKDYLFQDGRHLKDAFQLADHLLVVSMNSRGGPFPAKAWENAYLCTAVYYVNAMQACLGVDAPEAAFWHFPCNIGGTRNAVYCIEAGAGDRGIRKIDESGRVSVQEIPIPRKMFIE